jgi:nucleoside phosphorylase
MQSHLIFHLERLAQLALDANPDDCDKDNESGHSSQSHQVQMRGRQESVMEDFGIRDDDEHWDRITDRDVTSVVQDMAVLFESTLDPVPEFRPGFRVSEWVRNLSAEDFDDQPPDDTQNEPFIVGQGNISGQQQQATEKYAHLSTYTVGWICKEPRSMSIALTMLDNRHYQLPVPRNDDYLYTLGTIGSSKVVIICPKKPISGTSLLESLLTHLQREFNGIKYYFITGVAGGIPPDVRLGDVVISTPPNHIQIPDLSQRDLHAPILPDWTTRSAAEFPRSLLAALRKVEVQHGQFGLRITEHIDKAKNALSTNGLIYLKSDRLEDLLFNSAYDHVDSTTNSIADISSRPGAEQGLERPCGSCDMLQCIHRLPRERHVYCGTTISSDKVFWAALERDSLRTRLGRDIWFPDAICLETDATGFMGKLPYLLVHGISDYADSHKNASWMDHATAAAAACVRELLMPLRGKSGCMRVPLVDHCSC